MQVGRLIGFLFYGELSVDSASDSEKRNGEVHEDGTSETKGDGDLWLLMEGGGGTSPPGVAGWDEDTLSPQERRREKE